MERARLSAAHKDKERRALIQVRSQMHLSQQEVAEKLGVSKVTVHRWEKEGDVPQPLHLRQLCTLLGKTAQQLGFTLLSPGLEQPPADVQTITQEHEKAQEESVFTAFRQHNALSRLMRIIWNWSCQEPNPLKGDGRAFAQLD
jgi:transcriptional regulator with XRE-family HTH domain